MCELFCHGCKKPVSSCPGHQLVYLWVTKQDLFVDEQVLLEREPVDNNDLDDLDDFDDFDDWDLE